MSARLIARKPCPSDARYRVDGALGGENNHFCLLVFNSVLDTAPHCFMYFSYNYPHPCVTGYSPCRRLALPGDLASTSSSCPTRYIYLYAHT